MNEGKGSTEEEREVWDFCSLEAVQQAVAESLKDVGLEVPRVWEIERKSTAGENRAVGSVFGRPLSSLPTEPYQYGRHTFNLPKVFVLLVNYLRDHVSTPGLFRKAGAVSRLKSLKAYLEQPRPQLPEDMSPHDAASLLKQFLRELPASLIPRQLGKLMEACVAARATPNSTKVVEDGPVDGVKTKSSALMRNVALACLLLPSLQLKCLCVLMSLLHLVAEEAGQSLMDASNLAVVMAPSLMETEATDYQNVNCSLRLQKGIVELLIQNTAVLGVVPEEVGVAALNLTAMFGLVKSPSQNSMDDNTLPDIVVEEKKQRTNTLSEMMLGIGNRLRRHKRAGSSDMNLDPPRKKSKLSELEPRPFQTNCPPAAIAPGAILTPLLGTATKYNFTLGRSFRLPFSPQRNSASSSSSVASLSISSPIPITSSSLSRNSLRPLGEDQTKSAATEGAESGVATSSSEAIKRPLPEYYNESYREAVNCGCASKRTPSNSTTAQNSTDGHGHCATMATTLGKELQLPQSSKSRERQYNRCNSHYSATLGINSMDLSRKSLDEDRFAGTSFTPRMLDSAGGVCQLHPQEEKAEEGLGGVSDAPFSPASLSASLGITTIKPSSRAAAARRHRDRSRMRQRQHLLRGQRNENQRPFVVNSSTGGSSRSMGKVKSGDGFASPLPPLLQIVEKNVANLGSSDHAHFNPPVVQKSPKSCVDVQSPVIPKDVESSDSSKASVEVAEVPGSLAGCAGGKVAAAQDEGGKVAGFGVSRESGLRKSQWFKSPWKRGMVFTPIKEGDKLTRRALAYVVDKEGSSTATADKGQSPDLQQPVIRKTRANVEVQEWVV